MIYTFDFFFRGFIILGVIVMIFYNIKLIKSNRKENFTRVTLKYYKTWLQQAPLYASYFSSVLIGLSIFRFGSLLSIRPNKELQISIFDILIMDHNQTIENQGFIILIGCVGVLLYMVFAIIYALSCSKLSKNFSDFIDIKEGNNLISDGIYSKIRHPMYLCEIMLPLSASLALLSWMAFVWAVFVITPLYILRAKKEDELLEHYYKGEFTNYKRRVGGFFPFFSK